MNLAISILQDQTLGNNSLTLSKFVLLNISSNVLQILSFSFSFRRPLRFSCAYESELHTETFVF